MQIWAVAKQMIAGGVRMKIALVFLILLGLVVLGLPFSISGDASLTGAVQSFLSYALTATGVLLGMLTIFMSRSLSDELVDRHVFLVMTKPVPRWQFILGKWTGMMLLNAAFLGFAGLVIYGMIHYIRWSHPPIDPKRDVAELANEVLVARHALKPRLPDFSRLAEKEFQQNLEEGLYANVPDFSAAAEKERLGKKHDARWRVVGPLDDRTFEFENVLCDRSPGKEIQIRYKANVSQYPWDEIFRAWWRVGDYRKGTQEWDVPIRHRVGLRHTIRIPAAAVADDHTLRVRFFNENPFADERQAGNVIEFRKSDEIEVLFVVGSFGGNLIRALIIIYCKLLFLGALAILAATVFSFPVACLTAFTVYILAGSRAFLGDALDMAINDTGGWTTNLKEFAARGIAQVYQVLCWVVPDFARFDPVETLVNGRNVPLVWVLQAMSDLVLLKTLIVLGLAMLLFHRREVAEVSI